LSILLGNSRNSPLSYFGWYEKEPYFWEEDKNFQELKKRLCIVSVLSLPEIGKPYKIYIDISEERRIKITIIKYNRNDYNIWKKLRKKMRNCKNKRENSKE
jgi:hypothetical protein